MKVTSLSLLPFVAVTAAWVVPDAQTFAQIPLESGTKYELWNKVASLNKWIKTTKASKAACQSMDVLIEQAQSVLKHVESPRDISTWIQQELEKDGLKAIKYAGQTSWWKHKAPWQKHKTHKPTKTIYELISQSKYSKNLTKIIDDNEEIKALLNSTETNHTIFAPVDAAFAHLHHIDHIPKDIITKFLLYHILPDVYSSYRLLYAHTAPSLLHVPSLGGHAQRLAVRWQGLLAGVRVNFYDKVIVPNIPATNGLIHAVASILAPPPPVLSIVKAAPSTFSTLELALIKTGLVHALNTTGKDTVGGTVFAPTNLAFAKLGPHANAFLFSEHGIKYLKALLQYHVVPDRTLYSSAFYDGRKNSQDLFAVKQGSHCRRIDVRPPSHFHVDLPTLLEKPIAVDIVRRGPFTDFKINAFVTVALTDVVAKDGVIQVVNSVIIPPRNPDMSDAPGYWDGKSEVELDDLKARLQPYVAEDMDEFKLDL